jgi:hypothetical protein
LNYLVKMRPAYAGPGSASSRWKPTQDPGKTSPSSNFGGNRPGGTDTNSAASKGANTQQQQQQQKQQESDDEKKE